MTIAHNHSTECLLAACWRHCKRAGGKQHGMILEEPPPLWWAMDALLNSEFSIVVQKKGKITPSRYGLLNLGWPGEVMYHIWRGWPQGQELCFPPRTGRVQGVCDWVWSMHWSTWIYLIVNESSRYSRLIRMEIVLQWRETWSWKPNRPSAKANLKLHLNGAEHATIQHAGNCHTHSQVFQ